MLTRSRIDSIQVLDVLFSILSQLSIHLTTWKQSHKLSMVILDGLAKEKISSSQWTCALHLPGLCLHQQYLSTVSAFV